MGWAQGHIAKLLAGETVSFRPRGNSMLPRIQSGQLCHVIPVGSQLLEVGDIVLCRVHGNEYLHLVKAIEGQAPLTIEGARYQIGNNRGGINGWISRHSIYGKLVRVE